MQILLNAFKKQFSLLKIQYFSNYKEKFEKTIEEKSEKSPLCFLPEIKTPFFFFFFIGSQCPKKTFLLKCQCFL